MTASYINFSKIPDNPGIYQFLDKSGQIIYIGKSRSLKKRVASYFQNNNLGPKTNLMISQVKDIKFIKVFSEFEAILLEANLIKDNQPFFNAQAKDDKNPLYIKITNDIVPLISTTRQQKTKGGVFLKGPFTSAKTAKDILKIVRRIFPYCNHKNPKKPCLYVHLGLCPYPYESKTALVKYHKNITRIKKLLNGQSKILIRELKKDMQNLSLFQLYEQADEIKKKILQLEFLSTTYHAPKEFLERPTLVDDITLSKLKDLQIVLNLKKNPRRIECYDISNISGLLATGSMVVFKNGQKSKDQYRKFKIKFSKKPDDYRMLSEVLTRRFKNKWPLPDLIIIDGGKGQLNCALNVLGRFKLDIPVISLAKRFEEIYTPYLVLPIRLLKASQARQLSQEIRDEAHRFAISYHRLLRSKQLLNANYKL